MISKSCREAKASFLSDGERKLVAEAQRMRYNGKNFGELGEWFKPTVY